ncbi:MAG: acyl-ACP--UDP-N-acetylglucosamine O-acyltransferase [Planctomycetota bacterium]
MPEVHPTAIVSPDAELADDVVVGPFCTVSAGVKLGPGCRLISHAILQGPLEMGPDNRVYPFACLGFAPQDVKVDYEAPGLGTVLGARNVFRESVTIHRGFHDRPTTVGDDNYLMANCHLGHDVQIGSHCMLANGAVLGGHVVAGDRVLFGGNCGIHQFVRIGRMAVITGGDGFTVDVPPFCNSNHRNQLYGINVVGLRRAGLREHVRPLREAYRILFRQGHTNATAVKLLREQLADDPLCMELAEFVATTQRGIARAARSKRAELHHEDA